MIPILDDKESNLLQVWKSGGWILSSCLSVSACSQEGSCFRITVFWEEARINSSSTTSQEMKSGFLSLFFLWLDSLLTKAVKTEEFPVVSLSLSWHLIETGKHCRLSLSWNSNWASFLYLVLYFPQNLKKFNSFGPQLLHHIWLGMLWHYRQACTAWSQKHHLLRVQYKKNIAIAACMCDSWKDPLALLQPHSGKELSVMR